jgi:hypothetical protein
LALIFFGCHRHAPTIAEAVGILAAKGHRVEVFHTSEGDSARLLDEVPTVLFLPLWFKDITF